MRCPRAHVDVQILVWCIPGASLVPTWCLLGAASVPPRCLPGAASVAPRCLLAPLDLVTGPSWVSKNPAGFSFRFTIPGTSLGQLWVNLEHAWANLGPTWSLLQPTWSSLGQLKAKFNQLETILGPISAQWNWKIIVFPLVFVAFLLCRHSCNNGGQVAPTWGPLLHTWNQNDPHLSRLVLNFAHLGSTWKHLGAILAPTWANFGAFWGQLMPSWGQLELHSHCHGPIMPILGSTWAYQTAILAPTWAVLEPSVTKFQQIPQKSNKTPPNSIRITKNPIQLHPNCKNTQTFAMGSQIPTELNYSQWIKRSTTGLMNSLKIERCTLDWRLRHAT